MDNHQKQFGLKSEKEKEKEFEEEVVEIRRVSRVVKGGRRIGFRAAVILGNKKGKIGFGTARANEVIIAVNKAKAKARKNITNVPIVDETIPFPIEKKYCGAKIRLLPASPGTGIIAGGSVRSTIELSGIKNILSKIIGSKNKIANVKAVYFALKDLKELYEIKKGREKKEETPQKKTKMAKKV